jgi:hypothetical protein
MNPPASPPRIQSYRSRAMAAFGISAFLMLLVTALFIGGFINRRDAAATPRDVTVAALSDRNAVPAETLVRVNASFERKSETSRGHLLATIKGSPDVIVVCDTEGSDPCGSPTATLVGRVTEGKDDMTGHAALTQFAKGALHLERDHVRVLEATWASSSGGDRVRATILFSIGGVLLALTTVLVVTGLVFRGRAKKDGSWARELRPAV